MQAPWKQKPSIADAQYLLNECLDTPSRFSPTPQPHLPWRLMPPVPASFWACCVMLWGALCWHPLRQLMMFVFSSTFNSSSSLHFQTVYLHLLSFLTFLCPRGLGHFHSFYFGGVSGRSRSKNIFFSLSHLATSPNNTLGTTLYPWLYRVFVHLYVLL